MEPSSSEDTLLVRRFNPLRSVRRGLKAACRWTIRLGRGHLSAASGLRGRRAGRVRAPPLASLSAAMLEPGEILELGDEPAFVSASVRQHLQGPPTSTLSPFQRVGMADTADSTSNSFPLVLRRPACDALAFSQSPHGHQLCSLQYHVHADYNMYTHHPSSQRQQYQDNDQSLLPQLDEVLWTRHHHHHHHLHHQNTELRLVCACDCTSAATQQGCKEVKEQCMHHRSYSDDSTDVNRSRACSSGGHGLGNTTAGFEQGPADEVQGMGQGYSLQHLLAVGSRQWGSGGWWDGRGLLKVKIYDFAIYANPTKAAHALRSTGGPASPTRRVLSCSGNDGGAAIAAGSVGGGSPAEVLVSPSSGVDMSLTIRACRNLPLRLLSQEFERILQRRHEKAGGRADDPALQELLSYFSKETLPAHVVTSSSSPLSPSSGFSSSATPSGGGDAVRKGASITFTRSSSGALMTEAGGRVLGLVHSPALAEALFDLYLGDQPVSKRAKAAASAALLEIAAQENSSGYRYRLQAGERLHCDPGSRGVLNMEACVLQVP